MAIQTYGTIVVTATGHEVITRGEQLIPCLRHRRRPA